jgi:hypothetical protein
MFVPHRKDTYGPPRPVTGIAFKAQLNFTFYLKKCLTERRQSRILRAFLCYRVEPLLEAFVSVINMEFRTSKSTFLLCAIISVPLVAHLCNT